MPDNEDLFDPVDETSGSRPAKVSRRRLFVGAGAAAAGAGILAGTAGVAALHSGSTGSTAAESSETAASEAPADYDGMPVGVPAGRLLNKAVVHLSVNGKDQWLDVAPHETLAEVLRERLGLTGTKVGCDRSECSACSVLVDGVAQNSCSLLAIREGGRRIETVEGLEQGTQLSVVQQAFMEHMGLQCGFCTPGQIMQATGLLRDNPNPNEDEIRRAMSGNLCKCAAYPNILAAVQAAAKAGGVKAERPVSHG